MALALTAAVAFALANTCARIAYHGGSSPLTVAAVRFLLPAAVLVVWLPLRGAPLKLPLWERWVAGALGAVTAVYTWAILSALGAIPLSLAILIFYLFPFVAAAMLAVCGWEKFRWQTLAAIVFAFAGLALALQPRRDGLEIEGMALAFVGALGLGVVVAVSSRVFGAGDSRPVTLHIAAVAATLLIAICAAHGAFVLPRTGFGWLGFVGSSLFYAFAIIAFFISISMIGPVRVSILSYVEPVASAGLGVALLGETLAPLQVMGIAIVVTALVCATLWRSRAR